MKYHKKKEAIKLIKLFPVLKEHKNIESLATQYIKHQIIPERYLSDAFHIAFASFHKIDYLVTWNIRHMASPQRKNLILAFNASKNIFLPIIATPEELIKQLYEQEL